MLPRALTSLLDSGKNKASSAAGPAAAAAPAAAGGAAGAGAASLQNAPFATPKHHATEGRNDLQKHAAPNSKTPWHWNTKAAPSKQAPMPNVAFWTDKKPAPKCSSHALKVLHNKVLAGGCETAKHHGPEGRNAPAGNGPQCLTLPSEPARNQLQSAAPIPSKQLHSEVLAGGCETAKHHGPEGRNDLQEHAVPRLDVPSGFW